MLDDEKCFGGKNKHSQWEDGCHSIGCTVQCSFEPRLKGGTG